jgi:hypothetical protein
MWRAVFRFAPHFPNSPLHTAEIAASLHGTYVAIKIKQKHMFPVEVPLS